MQSKYCKCGHVMWDNTCSRCTPRGWLATTIPRTPAPAGTAPNGTLTELRSLKKLLEQSLITEAEYDERRNRILATF